MLCDSQDGKGVWGRMDTCTYMVESLPSSPETITTLLIRYTPIQNKKFKIIGSGQFFFVLVLCPQTCAGESVNNVSYALKSFMSIART